MPGHMHTRVCAHMCTHTNTRIPPMHTPPNPNTHRVYTHTTSTHSYNTLTQTQTHRNLTHFSLQRHTLTHTHLCTLELSHTHTKSRLCPQPKVALFCKPENTRPPHPGKGCRQACEGRPRAASWHKGEGGAAGPRRPRARAPALNVSQSEAGRRSEPLSVGFVMCKPR